MPYPSKHLYLTFHWTDTREPDEGGQFGIRFDAAAEEVTQDMVAAAAGPAETFWKATASKIPAVYSLTSLRLALIGENGQYALGTFSRDHLFNPGVPGAAHMASGLPLQVASAVTLRTDLPRGQASTGRCFLPPLSDALQGTGRWTATQVDGRATQFATLLSTLNASTAFSGAGTPAFAAVFSKGTSKSPNGLRAFVRSVQIGTRPDVQRRRAKSVAEIYGATKPVTGPTP